MNCPYCGHYDSRVIDSRDVNDGIRRRRQCLACERRFTTYERLQPGGLYVIKKDGRREEFSREKLMEGIRKACEKRPLSGETLETIVDNLEMELYQTGRTDLPSKDIGDRVMGKLKGLDHIAYIRFASVYRDFADITMLKEEVDTLAEYPAMTSREQLPLLPPEQAGPKPAGRVKK